MFIDENDLLEINVYYKKVGHIYQAYTEKEFNELKLDDEKKKKFECLKTKMKVLDWGTYNQLQDEAMIENSAGDRQFNYKIYKENRLKKLIKEWSALSLKDGKPVPVNSVAIGRIAPLIAEAILRAYDEKSFVMDDEEKN